MRRLALVLIILLLPVQIFAQMDNLVGKSKAQLVAVEDYVTVLDSAYFTNYIGDRIYRIVQRLNELRWSEDYSTIANAVDSGNVVTIVPGDTVALTQTEFDLASDFMLMGFGPSSVIKQTKNDSVSKLIVDIDADTNVVISGVKIVGDTSDTYDTEFDYAIRVHDSKNVIIHNCIIDLVNGDGVYIDSSTNVIIADCYFHIVDKAGHANTFTTGRHGVACVGGDNITIANCIIEDSYGGIDFEMTSGDTARNITIIGNVLKNTREGILIQAATSNSFVKNVTVSGNSIKDTYVRAIRVRGGDTAVYGEQVYNVNICDNAIDSTYNGYGISIEAARYVSVSNNTVFEAGSNGFNMSDSSIYVSIIGNKFCNSDAYGLGIAACDTFCVIGNVLSTNVSGQIVNSGNRGYTWFGNIGYNYIMSDYIYPFLRTAESQARMDIAQRGTGEYGAVLKLWGRGNTISDTNNEVFNISYPDSSDLSIGFTTGGTGTKRNVSWDIPGTNQYYAFQDSASGDLLRIDGNGRVSITDSVRVGSGTDIWKIVKSGTDLLFITAADTFVVDSVRAK